MLWLKTPNSSQSTIWEMRFFLITALFVLIPSGHSSPSDWLLKIREASSELSFSGHFVYISDNRVETISVARRIRDGMMEERLYSLNGESREVIRDKESIWCYLPDQDLLIHDYRLVPNTEFPNLLPSELDEINKNYMLIKGGETRIADRAVQEVQVIPKDRYRYGYNLWADKTTGLLLRSDLVDMEGTIFEQYLFISVDIGNKILDSELESSHEHRDFKQLGIAMDSVKLSEQNNWMMMDLPSGFSLLKHSNRISSLDNQPTEHLVFSDGLSSVSVFIKEIDPDAAQDSTLGLSMMGSINSYQRVLGSYQITVLGEVPAATVEHLALNIMPVAGKG